MLEATAASPVASASLLRSPSTVRWRRRADGVLEFPTEGVAVPADAAAAAACSLDDLPRPSRAAAAASASPAPSKRLFGNPTHPAARGRSSDGKDSSETQSRTTATAVATQDLDFAIATTARGAPAAAAGGSRSARGARGTLAEGRLRPAAEVALDELPEPSRATPRGPSVTSPSAELRAASARPFSNPVHPSAARDPAAARRAALRLTALGGGSDAGGASTASSPRPPSSASAAAATPRARALELALLTSAQHSSRFRPKYKHKYMAGLPLAAGPQPQLDPLAAAAPAAPPPGGSVLRPKRSVVHRLIDYARGSPLTIIAYLLGIGFLAFAVFYLFLFGLRRPPEEVRGGEVCVCVLEH